MTVRDLTSCALVAALAGCAAQGAPGTAASPSPPAAVSVGANVQVSAAHANLEHGEELVDADPVNPNHLIACSGIWTDPSGSFPHNGIRIADYVSEDGGTTWKATYLSRVGAFDLDPVCAIGFRGVAYTGGASAFDPRPGHDWIARSTDGGQHWGKPAIFIWGDRDFIAVDSENDPHRGTLYQVSLNAVRSGPAPLGEFRSTDNGLTYSKNILVFANPTHGADKEPEYFSGPLAILPNGHVVEVAYEWPDSSSPKKIAVFVSADGGSTWSPPRVVGTRAGSGLISSGDFKEEGASVLPLVAADDGNGPFRNRIYVAWQDFNRVLLGSATTPAPQAAILLAYSDDEGRTWSQPVQVDDAPAFPARSYPEVFAPALTVNRDGIVAVTWFDGRGLADGSGGALRMAVSRDGGETFSPSFAVATAPTLIVPGSDTIRLEHLSMPGAGEFATDLRYHVFGQDTEGVTAGADGVFHPVWVDNRTGVSQLWTAAVTVAEHPVRNGDPSLAHLTDVTKSIDLQTSGSVFDRSAGTVTVDVALVNTSHHAVAAPIHLRFTSLRSVLGDVSVASATNGVSGDGAIFTFRAHGAMLAPNAATETQRLVFTFSHVHALTSADVTGGSLQYVSYTYRAFAAKGAHR